MPSTFKTAIRGRPLLKNSMVCMLLLVLGTATAPPTSSSLANRTSAAVTNINELNKELKKIDLAIRGINTFLVTLNSYATAFTNILKQYKIVEVLGVVYTIFAFLFSGQHLLTCLFAVTFFILTLDVSPTENLESTGERDEQEQSLQQ